MSVRCVVHFAKSVQDSGNQKTFALRLYELFNLDGCFAEIKFGSGGNMFVHYKGNSMPQAHQEIVEKLGGVLKSVKRSDYHFHDGSVQEYQEPVLSVVASDDVSHPISQSLSRLQAA